MVKGQEADLRKNWLSYVLEDAAIFTGVDNITNHDRRCRTTGNKQGTFERYNTRGLGGLVVRASAFRAEGPWFESQCHLV